MYFLLVWLAFIWADSSEWFYWYEVEQSKQNQMLIAEIIEDVPTLMLFLTVIVAQNYCMSLYRGLITCDWDWQQKYYFRFIFAFTTVGVIAAIGISCMWNSWAS